MNSRFQPGSGHASPPQVTWQNLAAEPVPAWGLVQLTSFNETTGIYSAIKPTSDGVVFVANGPVPVAVNAYGYSGWWGTPQVVLVNGTVVFGDTVGPVDDEWYATTDGARFLVVSDASSSRVLAVDNGGQGLAIQQGFTDTLLTAANDPRAEWSLIPSAVFSVYAMDSDTGALTDSGVDVTVYNRSDMQFDEDTFMEIQYRWGKWLPFMSNCEATELS